MFKIELFRTFHSTISIVLRLYELLGDSVRSPYLLILKSNDFLEADGWFYRGICDRTKSLTFEICTPLFRLFAITVFQIRQ